MMQTFTFTFSADQSDTETRTIRGLVIPLDGTAQRQGKKLTFQADSVTFNENTPLMMHHEDKFAIGRLTSSEWTKRGLEAAFKVSKTPLGDEALTLAKDGVLGLSASITAQLGGFEEDDERITVTDSVCDEVSMTPRPAMAGARVDHVSLSKVEAAMPEETTAAFTAALTALPNQIVEALNANRPEHEVVPNVQVNEAPLYVLSGPGGQHDFAADLSVAYKGDVGAQERINTFIQEKFAVATGDVAALTPTGFNPSLYVGPRPYSRTLTRVITQGTLTDISPFAFAKLTGVTGPFVSPHVQGVEPALAGGAVWGTQTVSPSANSGKAEFNREVIDQAGPQVTALVWNEMLKASDKAKEASLVAMLDGLSLPAGQIKALDGTDATLADNLDLLVLAMTDGERYGGLVAASGLYGDLYTARDGDGRKLFPGVGTVVNADGTANGRTSLDLNGLLAFQSKDTANSYLIDPSTVYQWSSTPRRLDFDVQVKSVYLGFWEYIAQAITDMTGIIRITHA